ncbi:PucR family transcriptional regulator [Streptomyces sp. ST2-7A]|uniref:PucR family transcriptional regulator n=1 Tax=Streptomyces sp. ST2-7A TaxID=2907214 RepID=UPI001F42067E|nr:PucR family transcriptional regulator [Streptomyces sp. ST2-7A]MCE7079998.1 PucR family transcriptional regulator [Streptomyces sp. ST2-7A]
MLPTLASLARHPALGLRPLTAGDLPDAPVRWAHVSELADPVPYLEGGELLLTTGLKIPVDNPDDTREYVRRLRAAGVVGLGFGPGIHHPATPPTLVEACRDEGLPLLEVPRPTPFIAISKVVSAGLAAERYRAATAGFAAQRELTRAASGPDGARGVLARLAGQLDGWAALHDLSGSLVAVAPPWAERRAAGLGDEVRRLAGRAAPSSAVLDAGPGPAATLRTRGGAARDDRDHGVPGEEAGVPGTKAGTDSTATGRSAVGRPGDPGDPDDPDDPDDRSGTAERAGAAGPGIPGRSVDGPPSDRVELHSLGNASLPGAVLTIGTDGPPDPVGRYVVQSAVAVLTLLTERSRTVREGERRLGGAVLRLLLAGEHGHAAAVASGVFGALLDGPLRVVAVRGPDGPGVGARGAPGAVGAVGDAAPVSASPEADRLVAAVEVAAARAGEAVPSAVEEEGTLLLCADGGAALAACRAGARAPEDPAGPLTVGLSGPVTAREIPVARRRALRALLVARRRGRACAEHDEVIDGSLPELLSDEAARGFAESRLRPLREHDARGRGDLVASLRAWLARHGQWDAAAADLGVHRHTLRYRMRRVEEILGRGLDDPDVRMELWLALKVADSESDAEPGPGGSAAGAPFPGRTPRA